MQFLYKLWKTRNGTISISYKTSLNVAFILDYYIDRLVKVITNE